MFSVCMCARFQTAPKECHLVAVKRILRYVNGTMDHGITYEKVDKFELKGYNDSDFGGDQGDSKSTTRYVFNFGSDATSWQSKK